MLVLIKENKVFSLPLEASQLHSNSVIVGNQHFLENRHFDEFVFIIFTTLAYLETNFFGNLKFKLNSYNFSLDIKKNIDNFDQITRNLFVMK